MPNRNNTKLEIGNNNISLGNGIFKESKYYTSSPQSSIHPRPISHPFYEALVYSDEFLYYLFEKKFGEDAKSKKGDTYRTPADQNYTSTSQHSKGKAMDFNWSNQIAEAYILRVLSHDFRNQGIIFKALYNLGIRGFGIYNSFSHLDSRDNNMAKSWDGGKFAFWNNRNMSQTQDEWTHEEFFAQYPQAYTMCENIAYSNDPVNELDFLQSPTIHVGTTNSPTLGGIDFGIISSNGNSSINTGINGGANVYHNNENNEPTEVTPVTTTDIATKAKNGLSLLGDQLKYMIGGFTMLLSKKDDEDGLKRYDWKQMATSFSSLLIALIVVYYFFKKGKSDV